MFTDILYPAGPFPPRVMQPDTSSGKTASISTWRPRASAIAKRSTGADSKNLPAIARGVSANRPEFDVFPAVIVASVVPVHTLWLQPRRYPRQPGPIASAVAGLSDLPPHLQLAARQLSQRSWHVPVRWCIPIQQASRFRQQQRPRRLWRRSAIRSLLPDHPTALS